MNILRPLILAFVACALLVQRADAGCVPQWRESSFLSWDHSNIVGGDFNGDGRTDLASTWYSRVTVTLTPAQGAGTPVVVHDQLTVDEKNSVLVSDVQGDGKPDLVVSDVAGSAVVVLPGNGDGTFGAAIRTATSISPSIFVTADFTGDGLLDVAFINTSEHVIVVRRGDGTGAFAQELARTPSVTDPEAALAADDLDGDGRADLVLTHTKSRRVDVFFARGDGTFDTPLLLAGGDYGAQIAIADLDADGDRDVATADWTATTLTILRNDSNRTFATAVSYAAVADGTALTLAIGDVTQDGVPDVMLGATNARSVVTFEGKGNSTFGPATYARLYGHNDWESGFFPSSIVIGRFDGDARNDIAVGDKYRYQVETFANNCGDVAATISADHPVVSVGDAAPITVSLQAPGEWQAKGYGPASGSVTLYEGTTVLGSGTLTNHGDGLSRATINVMGLALGEHALHAVYAGDDHYRSATTGETTQKITSVKVTVALTPNATLPCRYGQSLTLTASASASDGSAATGEFRFVIDGVRRDSPFSRSVLSVYCGDFTTHRYRAEYAGSATSPPAISDELTVATEKAFVKFTSTSNPYRSTFGQTVLPLKVAGEFLGDPEGIVSLYEGDRLLGSMAPDATTHEIRFQPALSIGAHTLRLVHPGDQYFRATTYEFRHDVESASTLTAVAVGGSAINVSWNFRGQSSPEFASIKRLIAGSWVEVARVRFSPERYTDSSPRAGVAYIYRVDAIPYSSPNTVMAQSNVAAVVNGPFADDPLVAGTPVRAQHVIDLVNAVNVLRESVGLPRLALNVTKGAPLRATDLLTVRSAFDEARAALSLPPLVYDTSLPGKGARVRWFHVVELRNALR